MEYAFPPHDHDLLQDFPELAQMHREMRHKFGPFAQGPAAVASRLGRPTRPPGGTGPPIFRADPLRSAIGNLDTSPMNG